MSTTTAAMLLLTADRLARQLHSSTEPVTLTQWETFDNTVFQSLHTLVGPGRRLTGHDSPAGSAAVRALQDYPTPLRPPPGETYSPAEAARLLGMPAHRVTIDALAGRIHAERVGQVLQIPSEELDHRPDLTRALSTDRHPLSKLSVALGAMTDIVAGHRATRGAGLTDDTQIASVMRHVLSLTAVAARHALSRGDIAVADRPLLIAQYAQRAVDALDAKSGYPQLWSLTSTSPPLTARNLNDRLEMGLRAWGISATQHLQHPLPSTDLIRNIANQGVHILAVTDALLTASPPHAQCEAPGGTATPETLRGAAVALRAAEQAWAGLTTGMPPSHDYVTASRSAFSALVEISSALGASSREAANNPLDPDRAILDLTVATRDLASLLSTVRILPDRLLQSELLFVRARSVAPRADILAERLKGGLVVARQQDAPNLASATAEAARQATQVSELLFARMADRFAEPALERTAANNGPLL